MQLFTYFILIYAKVNLYIRGGGKLCLFTREMQDCSKIQYTQFIFNTHILYSIHTFYIQYTHFIFNTLLEYSINPFYIQYLPKYIQYRRKNIQ